MKKSDLRKIIRENIYSILREALDFLNKPNDRDYDSKVKLTLERKITGLTAFYRMETDGWFRRYNEPGKGYGLMIREFKVTGQPKYHKFHGGTVEIYPVVLKYLPLEIDNPDEDTGYNWEKAKGTLMINRDKTNATAKDIERFVKAHIRTYEP